MPENVEVDEFHYEAEDLAEYFTGAMGEEEAEEIEAHLGKCALCRRAAEGPARRAFALYSWTPEAHRQAMRDSQVSVEATPVAAPHFTMIEGTSPLASEMPAAALTAAQPDAEHRRPQELPKVPQKLSNWNYFWPIAATLAATAAGVILVLYIQQQGTLNAQRQQVARLAAQEAASAKRARELEQEVAGLRARLTPQSRPGRSEPQIQMAAVTLAPLTPKPTNLGSGEDKREIPLPMANASSFRLIIRLPNAERDSTIDVFIKDGQRTLIAVPSVPLEPGPQVTLTLSREQAQSLLNRTVLLTVEQRGHATLAAVTLTFHAR